MLVGIEGIEVGSAAFNLRATRPGLLPLMKPSRLFTISLQLSLFSYGIPSDERSFLTSDYVLYLLWFYGEY